MLNKFKALLPREIKIVLHYLVRAPLHFFSRIFLGEASADVTDDSASGMTVVTLPLVWMDEAIANQKGVLRSGQMEPTYGPHYIDREQSKEYLKRPDIHYYVFERARVFAKSSSVIPDDQHVIIDRAIGPDKDSYSYANSHIIEHHDGMAVVSLGKAENIKKGIFLGGNGSANYYHWMVEIIPKLEFLSKLPDIYQKYPLLVSESVFATPSMKETLDLFAQGCECIVLRDQQDYVVGDLIYINTPSSLPFNLRGDRKTQVSDCAISSHSVNFVRDVALQKSAEMPMLANHPKKIFFGRKSSNRNYNQEEVFDYLATLGFVKIYMEEFGFIDQVNMIHNADYLVGPTGAAWTNLIFCRSGAKGLCWMAEETGDFAGFSCIAGIVGFDLRYVTYSSPVTSTRELYRKDYHIDLDTLMWGLSALDPSLNQQIQV